MNAQALEHVIMLKFLELISLVHFGRGMNDDLMNEMFTAIFELNSVVSDVLEELRVPLPEGI